MNKFQHSAHPIYSVYSDIIMPLKFLTSYCIYYLLITYYLLLTVYILYVFTYIVSVEGIV